MSNPILGHLEYLQVLAMIQLILSITQQELTRKVHKNFTALMSSEDLRKPRSEAKII